MNRKILVLALIIAFLFGGFVGDEARPKPERPVLKFLGKVARLGMWLLVIGEPQKPEPQFTRAAPDEDYVDHYRSL